MCAADKVWITKTTLTHKNIRSVCHLHAQVYRSIWRKAHYDVTENNIKVSSKGIITILAHLTGRYNRCYTIFNNVRG